MQIKAVIFDLDNTLYNSDYCYKLAEENLLKVISQEFQISQDYVAVLLKNAKNTVKKQLGENVASSHNRLLYMQNICEQLGKNPLLYALKFYDAYWDVVLDNMKLFNYVLPLFTVLKNKGIKIGILTDLTANIQYRKMLKLGIAQEIDAFVTSEEAGVEKPSEDGFRVLLQKLNIENNEAIMIGDSYEKDVLGAKKAGIRSVRFEDENKICSEILDLIGDKN